MAGTHTLATTISTLEANDPDKPVLNLYGLKLGDAGVGEMSKALKTNTTITTLILGSADCGDAGAKAIAEALETNTTLTTLFLGDNKIADEGAKAFGAVLKDKNTTLSSLYLWRNQIGAPGGKAISDALVSNTTLTTLDLGWNDIRAGSHDIAESLKKNQTLLVLHFHTNQVDDDGATRIADAMKSNRSLIVLNLGGNVIREQGATAMGEALKINPSLTTLNLGSQGNTAIAATLKDCIERNIHNNKMRNATLLPGLLRLLNTPSKQ